MQQVPTWLQKQDNLATLQGIQSQSDPDGVVEGKEELGQYVDADG